MMLRYTFTKAPAADRIEAAVKSVLAQGLRTADIYEAARPAARGNRRCGDQGADRLIASSTKRDNTPLAACGRHTECTTKKVRKSSC